MNGAHLWQAAKLTGDPLCAAPLDPDHHQTPHRIAMGVFLENHSKAHDMTPAAKPLNPTPHRRARHPKQ